jgi:hypothetical protein
VGTHFPSYYKCSWESGPDNWITVKAMYLVPAMAAARQGLVQRVKG